MKDLQLQIDSNDPKVIFEFVIFLKEKIDEN